MQQPDGTTIQVYLHGDENGSYITTADGYLITKDVDGYLKYTTINKSNEVEITNIIARNKEDRNETDNKFLSSSEMQNKNRTILFENIKRQRIVNNVRDKAILNYQKENQSNPDLKNSISPKFLVILVNFADIKFTYSAQDFHAWLNEPGNDRYGATGSVKDYFLDNSDNYFSPEFDVVGPVDLKYPVIYYGMNSSSYGTDIGAEEMIYEACLKAYSQYGINMADYDNTGNGFVDNINVVFAGYSESSTAIENLIWPHSYYLSWRPQIGNAQIYNYTCSAELLGDSGANIDGMGTFTHEFLHFLGLKDLYDTDGYNNGYGLDPGDYSIMASGNYNNNGRTPPNLMAYERFMLGWGSPVKILNEPEDIILDDISTNSFYAINARPELNDPSIHGMEWFFLENRQRTGWDTYIPAGGLLITHWDFTLDYGYNFWLNNMPNNYSKHRCLYIKCADNVDDILTRNGDTYPGRSGNTEFTPLSYPAAISWTNEDINAPVTNIREENGKILFQVNGGINRISEIKTNVPTGITDQSAKVTATIVYADNEITSTGFCWAKEGEVPTINSESVRIENISDSFNYEITGLNSFTHYRVRSFMELSNGQIIYGASIPFL